VLLSTHHLPLFEISFLAFFAELELKAIELWGSTQEHTKHFDSFTQSPLLCGPKSRTNRGNNSQKGSIINKFIVLTGQQFN